MYRKSEKKLRRIEEADCWEGEMAASLCHLAFSRNSETRARAAALLALEYNVESEKVLYHLTFDRDELVRLEAVDSLSIGKTVMSLQRLEKLCFHKDSYIRFFAVQSHYDVYRNLYGESEEVKALYRMYLSALQQRESEPLVLLALHKSACLCGDSDAMSKIIGMLTDAIEAGNHSLISPALNLLEEITEPPTPAIAEAIEPFLDRLDRRQLEKAAGIAGEGTFFDGRCETPLI